MSQHDPVVDVEPERLDDGRRRVRHVGRQVLQIGFGLAAVAAVVYALASRWAEVQENIREISPAHLVAATLAAVGALLASMMAWRRILLDLDHDLPRRLAAQVYFAGQLAKYLPGSLWSVLAQAQLARTHGVTAARSAGAALVQHVIALGVSLILGTTAIPFVLDSGLPSWTKVIALASPLGIVLFAPPVLNRMLRAAATVLRRPAATGTAVTWRGVGGAVGWTALSWVLLGAHVAVLCAALGGTGVSTVVASVGAYALAWSIGFLMIVVPAGAGIRELVLVVALTSRLPGGADAALTVAVVSRLVTLVADVLVALPVLPFLRRGRSGGRAPELATDGSEAGPADHDPPDRPS